MIPLNRNMFKSHYCAFTLIELMLVLVIISVFAGLILTHMRVAYSHAALNQDANLLVDLVHAARGFARVRNTRCRLVIDRREGEYWLLAEGKAGEPLRLTGLALGDTMTLSQGIVFRDVLTSDSGKGFGDGIWFQTDGSCAQSVIILSDPDGQSVSITVSELPGETLID